MEAQASSSTMNSPSAESNSPDSSYMRHPPTLQQVNNQKQQKLASRRFTLAIKSIHYYRHPGAENTVRCAILLSSTFDLGLGERIAFAKVPLIARDTLPIPPTEGATSATMSKPWLNIIDAYPEQENFTVESVSGTKTIHATPAIRIDAGVGFEVGGMGVEKKLSYNKQHKISLQAVATPLGPHTTMTWHVHLSIPSALEFCSSIVNRKFMNEKGVDYPNTVKLLVIVQKDVEGNESWFPFRLLLDWELKVDVHTQNPLKLVARYFHTPHPHDGWQFRIRGNYEPLQAAKALQEALDEDNTEGLSFGLKAAAKKWGR